MPLEIPEPGRGIPRKLRPWLSQLRKQILTGRGVAGKSVSVSEFPGKGTLYNVADSRCCPSGCSACALPDGECPQTICVDVRFDADDDSDGDIIDLQNSGDLTNFVGIYPVISPYGWQLYTNATLISFIAADNPRGDGLFHRISATFIQTSSSTVSVTFTVDGVSDIPRTITFDTSAPLDFDSLLVGSNFHVVGTNSHRTIKCVSLLANPSSSEQDFIFPPDSFDSFTAGASIVSGQLRIDSSGDDYAEKILDPPHRLICGAQGACCIDAVCSIKTEEECNDADGIYHGDDTNCEDPSDPCAHCINDEHLCATFSGIDTCCYPIPGVGAIKISGGMNGSFTLPRTVDSGGGVGQWEGPGGMVHIKQWNSGICDDGEPDLECDCPTYILMQCIGPPATEEEISHFLSYSILGEDSCAGTISIFQSGTTGNGNIPFGVPEPNVNDCITIIFGRPVGIDGTVSFAPGEC